MITLRPAADNTNSRLGGLNSASGPWLLALDTHTEWHPAGIPVTDAAWDSEIAVDSRASDLVPTLLNGLRQSTSVTRKEESQFWASFDDMVAACFAGGRYVSVFGTFGRAASPPLEVWALGQAMRATDTTCAEVRVRFYQRGN